MSKECKVCQETVDLVGINDEWFCMLHLDEGFSPIGDFIRRFNDG